MGMVSRGENAEIMGYLGQAVTSELSGNVNDLCPVGALTHKPWSFNYRPWELQKTETIDVMDALGSHIRVDNRGAAVLRVLPRICDSINEEWISDKTRYALDGLSRQRLDRPYVRKNGSLSAVSWDEALRAVASALNNTKGSKIGAIAGDLTDVETMIAAKDFFYGLGVTNLDCRQDGAYIGPLETGQDRSSWLFNTGIADLERADAVLIIGSNLRIEAPLINTRLRKSWLARNTEIGFIGQACDLTYDYNHIGLGPKAINDLKKQPFYEFLKNAKYPAILVGRACLSGPDGAANLKLISELAHELAIVREDWNGFNIVHQTASSVGGLDVGFVPVGAALNAQDMMGGGVDLLFLLGADEIEPGPNRPKTIVYMGHHGDKGAMMADIILPTAAFTEKSSIYVNLEGRVQLAERCVFPKGDAKEDWAVLRALSELVGKPLGYDSLDQLRQRLFDDYPHMGQIGLKPALSGLNLKNLGKKGAIEDRVFTSPLKDFYLTNPIARASLAMAECSVARSKPALMAAE
jgi:NADH-quinone oxidoreductase subunit G